jgi:hypothetical protein
MLRIVVTLCLLPALARADDAARYALMLAAEVQAATTTPAAAPPVPVDPAACSVRVARFEGNRVGCGSGTVVACQGGKALIVTNHHVAPNAGAALKVKWPDGTERPATWLASDPEADLAALVVAGVNCPCVALADVPAAVGAEVVQVGYGMRGVLAQRRGSILPGLRFRGRHPVTSIGGGACQSEHGDSGGGVFHGGKLAAVLWGGDPGQPSSCVSHGPLKAFVDGCVAKMSALPAETKEPPLAQSPRRCATYGDAYRRAVAENQPLAVWVGFPCSPCQESLPECLHVNVPSPWHGVTGPAVVVSRPRGGVLYTVGTHQVPLGEAFDKTKVQALLAAPNPPAARPQVPYAPPMSPCGPGGCAPQFVPRLAPPVFAPGFGGGCGPRG